MSDRFKLNFSGVGKAKRKHWIKKLITEFAEEHDINHNAPVVTKYICTPAGCREFVNWLAANKFEATYWELEPHVELDHDGRKHVTQIGFGVELNPNCERFVEYKLVNGQDEDEN